MQKAPDGPDGLGQAVGAHVDSGPDRFEQLLLRDNSVPIADEVHQHTQGLGLNWDERAPFPQLERGDVDLEITKGVRHLREDSGMPSAFQAGPSDPFRI